ncbi:MAG: DUF1302 family protein [Oceanococcaceae bacterium]
MRIRMSQLGLLCAAGAGLLASTAHAGINVSFGGFLRLESAYSTTDRQNLNNQDGNPYNNVDVERNIYLPPSLQYGLNNDFLAGVLPTELLGLVSSFTPVPGLNLGDVGKWGAVPLPMYDDTVRRSDFIGTATSNDVNYAIVRGEAELGIRFSRSLRFVGRVRGIYDPDIYDAFDASGIDTIQGGIDSGYAPEALYEGETNHFDYLVQGNSNGNPLEWTGRDYQVYLPAAILEYNRRGLNVRIGNQQIAWGQSIFFRVFDLPNGLDLRRHSILDRALEEFSDKRVPMLSARVTWQVTNEILMDSYVGKFQPTVFGNPNTAYNVIPSQFTVHDNYKAGGYDDELVYGVRFKGDYGQFGFQAAYSRRYGTEGYFGWTESGVHKPLVGDFGSLVNLHYSIKQQEGSLGCPTYNQGTCRRYADSAEALAHASFSSDPGGVYSAEEWFGYAADVRLDGVLGLATAAAFPGAEDLYATAVENVQQADAQVDTLIRASGGSLRGHVSRNYHQENVFALGGSYVIDSSNDFLNQLILNLEVQYTPERAFTAIDLNPEPILQDEYIVSLVMDKWHRFFNEFPGTYIVFQALTKNRSDLVGRHLSGYGGVPLDKLDPEATRSTRPKTDNANYLVFGFLQPWPNKIYELEFATLLDLEGGILVQPGLRWNPGSGVTVEGFYNYINGELWGRPSDNLLSSVTWADEVTVRLSYQF